MAAIPCDDWRELAEAARKEQDSEKLIELVTELNRVLEEQGRKSIYSRTKNGV